MLISQHADGQLIAEVVRHLRFRVVAGSTTRGCVEAVRQMLRLSRSAHLAITPDGPRGPRRRVQAGVIYLAARTGLPVVPFGIAYANAWRMRSWDCFAIPRPWSLAVCVTGQPIHVPENVGKDDLESYRLLVEEQLNAVTAEAEHLISRPRSLNGRGGRRSIQEPRVGRPSRPAAWEIHSCTGQGAAMVPPPLTDDEFPEELPEVIAVPTGWVRGTLAGLAVGLTIVFAIALWLDPYETDGSARRMETHRQLGLPPCTFYSVTGMPCPSCGMTTSFALLVRGDVGNSLRANAVGTLLALFGMVLIPWSVTAALTGRTPFVRSLERAVAGSVLVFLGLMLLRWAVVIGTGWWRVSAG